MQSNTTGGFMSFLSPIMIATILVFSLMFNITLLIKMKLEGDFTDTEEELKNAINVLRENLAVSDASFKKSHNMISDALETLQGSINCIKTQPKQDAVTEGKPNNWDRIKEAFKHPERVVINDE